MPLQLDARGSPHLKAWAVRTGNGWLHVLLIDKGGRSVRVRLGLPTMGSAALQRLSAPSARARFGVTLDGQRLGATGSWQGRAAGLTVKRTRRGYLLTVPRVSAALLSVRLSPQALDHYAPEPTYPSAA